MKITQHFLSFPFGPGTYVFHARGMSAWSWLEMVRSSAGSSFEKRKHDGIRCRCRKFYIFNSRLVSDVAFRMGYT